jgi:hypothetical protein
MKSNLAGASVRISSPRSTLVRSWRSLCRKRWELREHIIFVGRIESGSLTQEVNQPARVNIYAIDALASLTENYRSMP